MKTITEDQWIEQYKPTLNVNWQDPDREWNGCMYETFGEDLAHVQKVAEVNPDFVWTLLETDGQFVIVAGMHFVNRFGYFITELPADEDFIDVEVEDLTDHDDEDDEDEYDDEDDNILGA